jgi:hypothetical protein
MSGDVVNLQHGPQAARPHRQGGRLPNATVSSTDVPRLNATLAKARNDKAAREHDASRREPDASASDARQGHLR